MRLLPLALLLLITGCFPQNVKDPSSFTVSQVIEIPETEKLFIYGKTEEWFAITFHSGSDVIKVKNPQTGTIIGRGLSHVVVDFATKSYFFLLKVETKDNKLRYTAQDFYWADTHSPITRQSALEQIEAHMKNSANSLVGFIKNESIASDW